MRLIAALAACGSTDVTGMLSARRILFLVAASFACAKPDTPPRVADPPPTSVAADSVSGVSRVDDRYLISQSGIGKLALGMSLAEARRALPAATFARTSDGDGAALVEVTLAPGTSMIAWAQEDDADAPIDWSKRIRTLETFSPAFHTAEGVRPGALVADAANVFGKTREILLSEIESREYITFEAQPAYLTLRLDYTGIFSDQTARTTSFEPGAKILSIAVSSQ